jgi:hypothetical protein
MINMYAVLWCYYESVLAVMPRRRPPSLPDLSVAEQQLRFTSTSSIDINIKPNKEDVLPSGVAPPPLITSVNEQRPSLSALKSILLIYFWQRGIYSEISLCYLPEPVLLLYLVEGETAYYDDFSLFSGLAVFFRFCKPQSPHITKKDKLVLYYDKSSYIITIKQRVSYTRRRNQNWSHDLVLKIGIFSCLKRSSKRAVSLVKELAEMA